MASGEKLLIDKRKLSGTKERNGERKNIDSAGGRKKEKIASKTG